MDTELLRAFVAITETGNFTAAALRINRTQSAVSQQVKRLENLVGKPLFRRSSAGVSLTDHGQRLLPHARRILGATADAMAEFRGEDSAGFVAIGMPEIMADTIIPRVMPSFRVRYPRVTLQIDLRDSSALFPDLQAGTLDLSFLTEGEIEGLRGPVMFTDSVHWVAPIGRELERLRPLPLITWRRGSGYDRIVRTALEDAGIPYEVTVRTQAIGGMTTSVASNLGVAAVTRSKIDSRLRVVGPEAGLPDIPPRRILLASAPGPRDPIVARFAEHAARAFDGYDPV